MNPNLAAERHRRDIDGMRAVAVVLVILYHLNRSFAPSGFVGVDIFFVISGFVVTRSSLTAEAKTPVHAVGRFWRRRILRILPAMLLTAIATFFLLGTITAPFPIEAYHGNLRTGLCAIIGMGNLYLFRGSSDYFRADSLTNPFVHTWSLGVEEQFYFLFALLFIGAMGLLKLREKRLRIGMAAMTALGVASYVAFVATAPKNPVLAYYCIPFRFWEIATGSALAYCELKFPDTFRPRAGKLIVPLQLLALASLATVAWSRSETRFPSSQISIAVLAAALLIVTGGASMTLVSRILSSPLFVGIGLISYSLYLWHYPVLLFWRTNFGLDHLASILLALLTIFIAATVSYWTVERTFRYSKASFAKVLLPSLCVVVFGTFGFAWLLQAHPGIVYTGRNQLWDTEWRRPQNFAYAGSGRIQSVACDLGAGSAIPNHVPDQCISATQAGDTRPTLFLAGDSHAYSDWGMASFGASTGAYRLATLVHDGCGVGGDISSRAPSCQTYWNTMPSLITNTLGRNDTLLIASYWSLKSEAETKAAMETIAAVARTAKDRGAEVIVEAPLPVFTRPAYFCTKEWYRTNYEGCTIARSEVERQRTFVMEQLEELAARQTNIRIWDALPLVCPSAICTQFHGDAPVFRDMNHLSYYGAQWLGPSFVRFWQGKQESGTALAHRAPQQGESAVEN